MPNGDGFDVLREVYPEHKPSVIFTTAYDQYTIRAFEVEALDYLLKPFTADRFHAALDRALRARSQPAAEPRASESKVANLLAHSRRTSRATRASWYATTTVSSS